MRSLWRRLRGPAAQPAAQPAAATPPSTPSTTTTTTTTTPITPIARRQRRQTPQQNGTRSTHMRLLKHRRRSSLESEFPRSASSARNKVARWVRAQFRYVTRQLPAERVREVPSALASGERGGGSGGVLHRSSEQEEEEEEEEGEGKRRPQQKGFGPPRRGAGREWLTACLPLAETGDWRDPEWCGVAVSEEHARLELDVASTDFVQEAVVPPYEKPARTWPKLIKDTLRDKQRARALAKELGQAVWRVQSGTDSSVVLPNFFVRPRLLVDVQKMLPDVALQQQMPERRLRVSRGTDGRWVPHLQFTAEVSGHGSAQRLQHFLSLVGLAPHLKDAGPHPLHVPVGMPDSTKRFRYCAPLVSRATVEKAAAQVGNIKAYGWQFRQKPEKDSEQRVTVLMRDVDRELLVERLQRLESVRNYFPPWFFRGQERLRVAHSVLTADYERAVSLLMQPNPDLDDETNQFLTELAELLEQNAPDRDLVSLLRATDRRSQSLLARRRARLVDSMMIQRTAFRPWVPFREFNFWRAAFPKSVSLNLLEVMDAGRWNYMLSTGMPFPRGFDYGRLQQFSVKDIRWGAVNPDQRDQWSSVPLDRQSSSGRGDVAVQWVMPADESPEVVLMNLGKWKDQTPYTLAPYVPAHGREFPRGSAL